MEIAKNHELVLDKWYTLNSFRLLMEDYSDWSELCEEPERVV